MEILKTHDETVVSPLAAEAQSKRHSLYMMISCRQKTTNVCREIVSLANIQWGLDEDE